MDDLKRLEEKQKLTNLQIEKRFVDLENSFDEIKTGLEKTSLLEGVPKEVVDFKGDVEKMKNEIALFREEKKKELEQITALVDSLDVSELKKDFEEIKNRDSNLRSRFEEELKGVQMLQERILESKTTEKIQEMFIKLKKIESHIESINLRLSSLERKKLTEPIFIE